MRSFSAYNIVLPNSKLTLLQDTVPPEQDTIIQPLIRDSLSRINDSVEANQSSDSEAVSPVLNSRVGLDRTESDFQTAADYLPFENDSYNNIPYQIESSKISDDNHLHFLKNTKDLFYYIEDSSSLVYSRDTHHSITLHENGNQDSLSFIRSEQLIKPDWLIGIIIGCLVLFAWLKLFYNKFIDQTFISFWNYQLSENFLRDQSMFSRRVSLLLNLNFIITAGLFFYLVAVFFNINPWELRPPEIFFASTGIVALMLLARYTISHITGIIFNYHTLFKSYLSQILIIYKIAGIILIPIIMAIAYTPHNIRIYLIISGLIILSAGVLFRFVKGIQLIFNKDLSIFYLILYLCTLEFLPALVIYKFFSSLV